MLLWLAHCLERYCHALSVFQYLTLRSIIAALTALVIALVFSPALIRLLQRLQVGQTVRDCGPQTHLKKSGTPTMGGLLMVVAIVISMLLWGDLTSRYIWVPLLTLVGFSAVGFWDDYLKVVKRNSKGLSAKAKIFCQSVVALAVLLYLYHTAMTPLDTTLFVPFFKSVAPQMGAWFILFGYCVIVGSSNAVNLTDGLDGLALLPTVLVAGALGVFAYLSGNHLFSDYLIIPHLPGAGEMAVFTSSLVGAGLGFLWFNTYPAAVFMGDVGSLGLGAALGVVAVMVRQELVFFVMGGVFVIETVSVILQVASFKLTGKRIFRMAPLHHHFELKGWPEPKVIVRFWIITFILVLVGLATLKLR